MIFIIAGSRYITDYDLLLHAIKTHNLDITGVISGCARGVDTLGERYAQEMHLPVAKFPAEWDLYGKSAGAIRNGIMAQAAKDLGGALLLVWNGYTKGSANMKRQASDLGLKIYEYKVALSGNEL